MKKIWSVSAGLIFLVAVTVFAFAQQGQQMEAGKSEMKGMMEGAKETEMKEGMTTEKMDAGKSGMKDTMEQKGAIMEGEMKKEATGMMK